MPKLSAFTPLGLLRLSGRPSPARSIYESMTSSLGGQLRLEPGDHVEASLFARALGLARSLRMLEHAGEQANPRRVAELLPVREDEYGIVPAPGATLAERRRELAARRRLPLGASANNVTLALRELLGDDFIAYRPTPKTEAVLYPESVGDQPINLQQPEVPRKLVRLTQPISVDLGSPQWVRYAEVMPGTVSSLNLSVESYLTVGDVLVVEPESATGAERVTVEELGLEWDDAIAGPFYPTIKATFNLPHAANATATTMPYPQWTSTKRFSLILLKTKAAADPEKRRKVHELMARIARGVSTWAIAGSDSITSAGPFRVNEGKLGITPIGTIAL